MQSLWFIVPAHGRLELAAICLRQLRRTCDALEHEGIRASAVVIADDENLDTATDLGFATIPRNNRFLSRKFNDGIQLALDLTLNKQPASHVVPVGTDDWVDWRLFTDLPDQHTMVGWQHIAFVREDARELTVRHLNYEGGSGIRIYPRAVMRRAEVAYRPADEYRTRVCDTSILVNLKRNGALRRIEHRPTDGLQIVDWKSHDDQVTPYKAVDGRHRALLTGDPFELLADRFPAAALTEMRAHYGARELAAA